MNHNVEYCDPFSGTRQDIWMKLEHCGRYQYACDFLESVGCGSVIDLACANGYGSEMLSEKIPRVLSADRNEDYLHSGYLKHGNIRALCFDFDSDEYPEALAVSDAVVCFETLEHLRDPFRFLDRITEYIRPGGWLLCSFPNPAYERLNPDGTNQDPFHLHLINKEKVAGFLSGKGFTVHSVLGQPVCNRCCTIEHELKESNQIKESDVDNAFRYDRASITALSRILARPQAEEADESYSFILTAQKA